MFLSIKEVIASSNYHSCLIFLHFWVLAEREDFEPDERCSDEPRLHQVQRGRQEQDYGGGRRHRVRGGGVQVPT